jgi:hypothetical protein
MTKGCSDLFFREDNDLAVVAHWGRCDYRGHILAHHPPSCGVAESAMYHAVDVAH